MFKVIGIRNVDYWNKNNIHIEGIEINTVYESANVEGYAVKTFYFSSRVLENNRITHFNLDDEIVVYYNEFGKVIKIEKV